MNVLLLGEKAALLGEHLEKNGHVVIHENDRLLVEDTIATDFIISFGYKFILSREIVTMFRHKIINLHISYLPFNRGADPNLWSFLENTPKGVTIHEIDESIDTGNILLQKSVTFSENDTLKTSYDKLIHEIVSLFTDNSEKILNREIVPLPQTTTGTYHQKADKTKYLYLLSKLGHNTPVSEIAGKALDKP